VGKSTLFNALTQTQSAEASNYPFCTIEPNSAKIGIYDTNIQRLTKAAQPHSVSPAQLEIWDIAGLVKGASKGEGLGNQFLGNIRNVNLIINVIRCFEDKEIQYVDKIENIDPVNEMDTIKTELILADLDVISRMKFKRDFSVEAVEVYK
jgi:ribosome-binding ATPase